MSIAVATLLLTIGIFIMNAVRAYQHYKTHKLQKKQVDEGGDA